MASRYKTTGCARFFFFLIFFVPLVYFGLKYLDDRGQLDEWRQKLDLDKKKSSVEEILEKKNTEDGNEFDVQQVKRQLAELLLKIEEQDQIIADQEETIKNQTEIINQLSNGNIETTTPSTQTKEPKKDGDNLSLEELLKEADKALKKN